MKKIYLLIFAALLCNFSTNAAQIVVSNSNDNGAGSLRSAVSLASSGDTIIFTSSTNGNLITLTSGEILIDKDLTIIGNDTTNTLISGNMNSRIFQIDDALLASYTLVLENIHLTMGDTTEGGAIHINDNTLSLFKSKISFSIADSSGGAIYIDNGGTVNIDSSDLSSNRAFGNTNPNGGGAIFNNGGTVNIAGDSYFFDNRALGISGSGGAIFNTGNAVNPGVLNVSFTIFSNNEASRAGGAIEDNGGASSVLDFDSVLFRLNDADMNPGNGGAIHLTGAANSNFNKCEFIGNEASVEGGAVWNGSGTMTIIRCDFATNYVYGDAADNGGGAIYNLSGIVNISDSSRILSNEATGTSGSGGGILNDVGGTINITNSTIYGNLANRAGGGIEDNSGAAGNIILTDVRLDSNYTGMNPGNGAGVHITGAGNLTMTGGSASRNIALSEGGGLWNGTGIMTLTNVSINDNLASGTSASNGGGGIFNNGGTLNVNSSTLNDNEANGTSGNGGAIHNANGTVTLDKNTISENSSLNNGGGIFNTGSVSITNSTIALNSAINSGGGYFQETGSSDLSITSTIVAANIASSGTDLNSTGGAIISNGYNLISRDGANVFTSSTGDLEGTTANPIAARLDTLADNGGLTRTHAILCTSPALNAGNPSDNSNDQRDSAVFSGRRDIGAFEIQDSCLNVGLFEANLNTLKGTEIYPNPLTDDNLKVFIPNGYTNNRVRIVELASGKIISETKVQYGTIYIDTKEQSNGMYLVQIINDDSIKSHKLIIAR